MALTSESTRFLIIGENLHASRVLRRDGNPVKHVKEAIAHGMEGGEGAALPSHTSRNWRAGRSRAVPPGWISTSTKCRPTPPSARRRCAGWIWRGGSVRRGAAVARLFQLLRAAPRPPRRFLGALRAGAVVAPLAPSVTRVQFALMLRDYGASIFLVDCAAADLLPDHSTARLVALDRAAPGLPFEPWLAPPGTPPPLVPRRPEDPFNIIYSSGTTGTPKGIVQPHAMRWAHVMRASRYGYDRDSIVLLATPLYSNTTLVAFFPALAQGGHVHLMARFDALAYLQCAQRLRATHTMLSCPSQRR